MPRLVRDPSGNRVVLTAVAEPARRRAGDAASLRDLGDVAEWLRSGLQSRLHRFDSGRRLPRGTGGGSLTDRTPGG